MVALVRRVVGRLSNEPILLLGAASISLTTLHQQLSTGVDLDTALLVVTEGLITWIGRQLVVPARKVVPAGPDAFVEPEIPPSPVWDDGEG